MAEAARVKGVSYHTVSRAVRSGKLPAQRLGRMALIASKDLDAWQPMRERAPRKYRRPEPGSGTHHELPAISDADPELRFADRLATASEHLLQGAASQPVSGFGDWMAQWAASVLTMDIVVVWHVDTPRGHVVRYGSHGLRDASLPAMLSDRAGALLHKLAERERAFILDSMTLRRLDGESWLPSIEAGSVLLVPMHSGKRCVGAIVGMSIGRERATGQGDLRFAHHIGVRAAFAVEHVELRRASRQQLLASPALFDDLPLHVMAVDRSGTLVYVNEEVIRQWGEIVRSRYVGRHYSHFVGMFKRETLDGVEVRLEDHPFTRALQGDSVTEIPYLVPSFFGASRVFSLSARPTHDGSGEPSGAVLISRDVTNEIEANASGPSPIELLADARRKVELLANLTTEIAQRRGVEDIFQIVAERVTEVLEADSCAVLTPTDESHMVVRASHHLPASFEGRVLNRLRVPSTILAMAHRDLFYVTEDDASSSGRELLKESNARAAMIIPLIDEDEALGVLAVQYTSVDRLRQVDPELARAIGRQCGHAVQLRNVVIELEASRRRLLTVLDQLPQAVVILDVPDGNIVAVNREAEKLWGPEIKRLGQHATDVTMLDTDGRPIPNDAHPFTRPLRTRQTELGVSLITRDASGELVDVVANVAPIVSKSGALRGTVAVLQRREHFKPIDQAKDEFISVVAHELRNPLTSLRGNLQLLERRLRRREDPALEREVERVVGVIEQVDRVGGLVSRMLDVSRADLGKLTIDPAEADAVVLARRAIEDIGGQINGRKVSFDAPESLPVEWDEVRVQQVLVNLLTNAVRYAPDGDIHVVVHNDPSEEQVSISVRDHGPGVPPSLRRRLFRLYYRFDDGEETADGLAARQRGLGIGLYISARLARAHGGELTVEDADGGGAVFTLTLPRVAQGS